MLLGVEEKAGCWVVTTVFPAVLGSEVGQALGG